MSSNQLSSSTSPYLLQHKDNPVHWHIWGPEALAEAERDNKPILLSIGYSACHWCHVMAHESFEDEKTAELMNALYVNIKVDREERPDIDQIYMAALHLIGEQGGWPLTMFLTPDGKPYWGGTYFPPEPRWGRPSFSHVLAEASRLYHEEKTSVDHNTTIITDRLNELSQLDAGDEVIMADIDEAASRIAKQIDPLKGGFRGAPKFPQFAGFELVARAGLRQNDESLTKLYLTTIDQIFSGGIYDHLAGGLSRYSVDENWLVPHFEKMLYDNAQSIVALTLAHQISPNPLYRTRINEIFDWLKSEMLTESGAFAASIDADSEGVEGKFYVWEKQEVLDILGQEDGEYFCQAYDVTIGGNWEGNNILNQSHALSGSVDLGNLQNSSEKHLEHLRQKLLIVRRKRIPPHRDDKVLTDWNGLTISAFAKSAMVFADNRYLSTAKSVFHAIVGIGPPTKHLPHSTRNDEVGVSGLASDYANMTAAALSLYEATSEQSYLDQARIWANTLETDFSDGKGSFFSAPKSATDLIVRMRSAADDPMPNHNAVALENYIKLECFTGNTDYGCAARRLANAFAASLKSQPYGHGSFLNAAEHYLRPIEVVITHSNSPAGSALAQIARQLSPPTATLQFISSDLHLHKSHPAAGKSTNGTAQAYICKGRTCSLPITDAANLRNALETSYKSQI